MHPPRTPEQVILAQIEELRGGVESRQTRVASKYLADDFTWEALTREELKRAMAGAFFQWRDVQLTLSNLKVTVQGNTAVTTGRYTITFSPTPQSSPETKTGDFKLFWEQQDDEWKIVKAEGGRNIPAY